MSRGTLPAEGIDANKLVRVLAAPSFNTDNNPNIGGTVNNVVPSSVRVNVNNNTPSHRTSNALLAGPSSSSAISESVYPHYIDFRSHEFEPIEYLKDVVFDNVSNMFIFIL